MFPIRKNVTFLCVAVVVCFMVVLYLQTDSEKHYKLLQTLPKGLVNKIANKTIARCSDSRSSKYVLALNYWEQLNMALHNLYSLTRLASVWDGVVVKPFTLNSRLCGLPHLRADENWSVNVSSLPLTDLFDSQSIDSLSCVNGVRMICEFDRFIRHANRKVIILHFIFSKQAREYRVLDGVTGNQLKNQLAADRAFECSEDQGIQRLKLDILDSLNREATTVNVAKFRLSHYWCINGTTQTTPQLIASQTGSQFDNATIIILNWRGIQTKSTIQFSAKGKHQLRRQFIMLPTLEMSQTRVFHPSQKVLKTSLQFTRNLTAGREFIGIHLRSEKLGQREMRIPDYIRDCLDQAINVKDSIHKGLHTKLAEIFVTDYGPFGSDSCKNCRGARLVKKVLEDYGIQPTRFDPLRHGVPPDSGFVSLVEMNTLLQSRYLILVGGGAYQKQMTMRIKTTGAYTDVYLVCWSDEIQVKKMSKNLSIL